MTWYLDTVASPGRDGTNPAELWRACPAVQVVAAAAGAGSCSAQRGNGGAGSPVGTAPSRPGRAPPSLQLIRMSAVSLTSFLASNVARRSMSFRPVNCVLICVTDEHIRGGHRLTVSTSDCHNIIGE